MLSILLIYFIGRKFYELAAEFNKHKWGFAILGIVAFYIGAIIFGIFIILYQSLKGEYFINSGNNAGIDLASIPCGLLACYGLYKYLNKSWERKNTPPSHPDILDDPMS